MARRRRRLSNLYWNGHEWREAWKIVVMAIDGESDTLRSQPAFCNALEVLDSGFSSGDVFQFQVGMVMILQCCNEAIERGDSSQGCIDG